MNVNKITVENPLSPDVLCHIPQPSKELYVLGNLEPLAKKIAVSIVGGRAVTPYGKQVTTRLAHDLAKQGIAIISG